MARQGPLAALIAILAAGSTLLTASCAPGPAPRGGGGPMGDLEVSAELVNSQGEPLAAAPRQGDIVTIAFHIRNATKNVVVLRDLSHPRDLMAGDSTSSVASWQFSQPGLLEFVEARGDWVYDRSRPAKVRRPIFNSGLLVPAESVDVRARVRLLEMPMDFQFRYFELSPDDVRRKVYFEVRQEREVRFQPLLGKDLEMRLAAKPTRDSSGHGLVVFPHAEPTSLTAMLIKTLRVQKSILPRPFTLEMAARKAGVPVPPFDQYTYSARLDGWVVPTKDLGYALVSPTTVHPLPELRQLERIFYLLDTVGPGKIEVELRGDSIASTMQEMKYPIVAQQKEVRVTPKLVRTVTDYYVFVEPPMIPKFMADLHSRRLTLDVEFNAEGGGRLQVLNK